jgi:hypothetical protein
VARWLAASELHLGIESELARRGAYLRSRSDGIADRLVRDADDSGATRLLLLGDVKHRVASSSRQEERDVPRFFARLLERFDEILITPGNHDAGLRRLLPRSPKLRLGRSTGETLGAPGFRVGALHGHTWPRPGLVDADVLLIGHTHAAASLVDEEGAGGIRPAWLRGRADPARLEAKYGKRRDPEVVIFPAYNELCGGTPINRDGLLGPAGSFVSAKASSLILLDGRRAMDLAGTDLRSRGRRGPTMD